MVAFKTHLGVIGKFIWIGKMTHNVIKKDLLTPCTDKSSVHLTSFFCLKVTWIGYWCEFYSTLPFIAGLDKLVHQNMSLDFFYICFSRVTSVLPLDLLLSKLNYAYSGSSCSPETHYCFHPCLSVSFGQHLKNSH